MSISSYKFQDWIDEIGEIHITPVEASFINSVQAKADKMEAAKKNVRIW